MKINLNKTETLMILEALEALEADVKHSIDNGYHTNYLYDIQQVKNLIKKLENN